MISALRKAGTYGIEDDVLGRALQKVLGFDQNSPDTFEEWLSNPKLEGPALNDANERFAKCWRIVHGLIKNAPGGDKSQP